MRYIRIKELSYQIPDYWDVKEIADRQWDAVRLKQDVFSSMAYLAVLRGVIKNQLAASSKKKLTGEGLGITKEQIEGILTRIKMVTDCIEEGSKLIERLEEARKKSAGIKKMFAGEDKDACLRAAQIFLSKVSNVFKIIIELLGPTDTIQVSLFATNLNEILQLIEDMSKSLAKDLAKVDVAKSYIVAIEEAFTKYKTGNIVLVNEGENKPYLSIGQAIITDLVNYIEQGVVKFESISMPSDSKKINTDDHPSSPRTRAKTVGTIEGSKSTQPLAQAPLESNSNPDLKPQHIAPVPPPAPHRMDKEATAKAKKFGRRMMPTMIFNDLKGALVKQDKDDVVDSKKEVESAPANATVATKPRSNSNLGPSSPLMKAKRKEQELLGIEEELEEMLKDFENASLNDDEKTFSIRLSK